MKSKAWWFGMRVAVLVGLFECVGMYGAIRLILSAYLLRRRGSRIAVRVRGLPHPVTIRARSSDILVFAQVFALQEYNFDEFAQCSIVDERYRDILATGRKPLIIDCGANVGFSALWYNARFPGAAIVAVEPSLDNFALLRENVSAYSNIMPLNAAIWDTHATLRIANPGDAAWARQVAVADALPPPVNAGEAGFEIDAVTISDLMNQNADAVPFITKIDIEGSESALFRSNTEWVPAMTLIAIEVHDRLQPFKMVGKSFYREIAKHCVEMIFSRENIFVFFRAPGADR